jgi:uncharacterized protein YhaN
MRRFQKKKAKLEKLKRELEEKRQKVETLTAAVEELKAGREETAEHTQLMADIAEKSARSAQLSTELARFAAFDPDYIDKLRESMNPVREAANRWTDNIYCCQSWISEKFGVDRATFFQQFQIPEDMDYLES